MGSPKSFPPGLTGVVLQDFEFMVDALSDAFVMVGIPPADG